MAKLYERIDGRLHQFLLAQPVCFVGTAPSAPEGHLNVTPKGVTGTFAVLDEHRVGYLDYTGSGVETIAHLRDNGRIVVMFCAFDGPPKIVRLHGTGEVVKATDERFSGLLELFPPAAPLGARAVIVVSVSRISDSCGFGVPIMRYVEDRPTLAGWARRKGADGVAGYQAERNRESIDGLVGLRRKG